MSLTSIISTLHGSVRIIQLNRPNVLNAVNNKMIVELTHVLKEDANDDSIVITILTGAGRFFSTGRDFLTKEDNERDFLVELSEDLMASFINYPKLLVAVVNGPAYGIGVTLLGLCDIVYASDRATFTTPFVNLGVTPEGASTYTFLRTMGRSKASELLLLGEKMTARDALKRGFVAKVIPHEDLNDFIKGLHRFGRLSVNTVKKSKELIVAPIKEQLYEIVKLELVQIGISLKSPEHLKAMETFLTKPSKL